MVKPRRRSVDKGRYVQPMATLVPEKPTPAPVAEKPMAAVPEAPAYDWRQSLDDVDRENAGDPQCVSEYAAEIMAHLSDRQHATKPQEGYLQHQREVTEKMRAILVDWLVEVHQKFKLSSEALFLAVSLLDRYLAVKPVVKAKLQLVGVVCLLLAAKFEEVYPPEIRDIVSITDRAYTRSQVLEMEVDVCNALRFKIIASTPYAFLQRYMRVMRYGRAHTHLAQYILELTLVDAKMISKYDPSHLASAAVYLSNKIMRVDEAWPGRLKAHTRQGDVGLKPCAKEMCSLLQGAAASSLQAVMKKFSSEKLDNVAKLLA